MFLVRRVLPLLLCLAAAYLLAAVFRYPLVTDDPYITYRYAANLRAGLGFVYNPGEQVLSTTAPLFAILLAVLGLAFADLPPLGFWLSVLFAGLSAYLLFGLALRLGTSFFSERTPLAGVPPTIAPYLTAPPLSHIHPGSDHTIHPAPLPHVSSDHASHPAAALPPAPAPQPVPLPHPAPELPSHLADRAAHPAPPPADRAHPRVDHSRPALPLELELPAPYLGTPSLVASPSPLTFYLVGLLSAAFFLASPALLLTFGLETGFYLFLALAAFYAYLRGYLTLSLTLAALLTLTRTDGILLFALLTVHALYAHRANVVPALYSYFRSLRSLRSNSRLSLWSRLPPLIPPPPSLAFLLLLFWFLFSSLYFGSPFPSTLSAKIAQAQSGLWDPFAIGLAKWFLDNALWLVPLLLCSLPALWSATRARSLLLMLPLWAALHLIAYSLLGVAFYPWYVAPLLPALALFAALGLDILLRNLLELPFIPYLRAVPTAPGGAPAFASARVVALVAFIGLILLVLQLRADLESGMSSPSPRVEAYRQVAAWFASNTPPNSSVDALEVGVIGFYDARRTLDFVGLIDPRRLPYLRAREFAMGVRRAAADYVLAIPPDTWLPTDLWFKDAYRPAYRLRFPDFYNNRPLVIYQRADAGSKPVETLNLDLTFEHIVALDRVALYTHTLPPGSTLPVRLDLRALAPAPFPPQLKLTLQLVAPFNRVVAQTDNFLPLRLPPDTRPFSDYQGIPVPATARPGTYTLLLALYDANTGDRLNLSSSTGSELGDFLDLGSITLQP